MALKNLDLDKNTEIKNMLKEAVESGDSEKFAEAQLIFAKEIQDKILEEAKFVNDESMDERAMAERGLRPLTAAEKKYYNEVIMNASFSTVTTVMPETIFDRVFEDLRAGHPLLSKITFQNTTGVTKWVVRNGDVESAWWGKLTDAISKQLDSAFAIEDTGLYKLSAFVPVCKAMLDLGPVWLDRFVREMLAESIAMGLESAIVGGDGTDEPIGLLKDLDGAVVAGVYPNKTPVALSDLKPATLGKLVMKPLVDGKVRTVGTVTLIVNPADYWEKIFPQTTFQTPTGGYVYNVLPIDAEIVQSAFVPVGKLVATITKDYFMGIGSSQKIEYSDEYKFLEDERVYITKVYANGKLTNNASSIVFDISTMGAPAV